MEEKFLRLFEEILEKDTGTVHMDDMFRDFGEWNSLATLALIAMVDENYGVSLHREDLTQSQSVRDLYQRVMEKTKA